MRYAVKLTYDGRFSHGFARQPTLQTIEGDLLSFLLKNQIITSIEEAGFRYASRTDKGVSAFGNVIALTSDTKENEILASINEHSHFFAYSIQKVSDEFFPRYAQRRAYRYYLHKDLIEHDELLQALSLFTGEHDMSNFARIEDGKNPNRIIDTIIVHEEGGNWFCIDLYAPTFLWHQVRRIIAAIIKVGQHKIAMQNIKDALEHPDLTVDFGLAPADHLILLDVYYKQIEFPIKKSTLPHLHQFQHNLISEILS